MSANAGVRVSNAVKSACTISRILGCPTACVHDAAFGYVNAFRDHVTSIGGFFFRA
jgi:hypothetical protein